MNIYSWPIFQNSVRCFFPLAALAAVLGPCYLVCVLINQYPFAHPVFNVFEWHAFEMLYGFLLTLIAGFILTAGGHWTGKGPLSGPPLVALFGLWFVDKFALFIPMPEPLYLFFAALFPVTFIFLLARLLKGYRQFWRFMGIIGFLSVSKLLYLWSAIYEAPELKNFAMRSTLWGVIALVSIIGGRVTPRFTKNFFKLKRDLIPPKLIELGALVSVAASIVWIFPHGLNWLNGTVLILAGVLNCVRVGFYEPFKAIKRPILGMLHMGYFIFALSLIYMGLAELFPSFDVGKASLHLLVTGGVSLVAINVMVRASLGHTGREIRLTPLIALMFACSIIGAFLRTFIPPLFPQYYYPSLHISMGFWTLGFIFYLLKFVPILLMKRADAN